MTLLKSSFAEESGTDTLQFDTKVMLGLHHAMKANADDEDVTKLQKEFIEKLKKLYILYVPDKFNWVKSYKIHVDIFILFKFFYMQVIMLALFAVFQ